MRPTNILYGFWVVCVLTHSAYAETFITPSKPVPRTYFGIHNIRFHDPKLRPTIKFGTWRLWDTGTTWVELEPRRGEWHFERLDLAISIANSNDLDVILTLGRPPQWASLRPNEPSFYGLGEAAPPSSVADYENYVETVAKRYAGRIRIFEVWNEPASSKMYSGTTTQMVELTAAAKRAIKRVDPNNILICPSPAKTESLSWVTRFVTEGGAKDCDVIGYHFYTDSSLPEMRIDLIQKVRSILVARGMDPKPIWDTESGFETGRTPLAGEASNSAHIARWLILTWAMGVERFYWYAWDHDQLGFVVPSGPTRNRELAAYYIVQRWMLGSTFQRCVRTEQLWRCDLKLKDGRVAALLWTQDNSRLMQDAGTPVWLEDLNGFSGQFAGKAIPITGDPVLVVW